jgi:hypothetical protein
MTRLALIYRDLRNRAELADLRDLFLIAIHRTTTDLLRSFR